MMSIPCEGAGGTFQPGLTFHLIKRTNSPLRIVWVLMTLAVVQLEEVGPH